MNKQVFIMIVACSIMISASSQTLFTYGKYKADAKEFLHAYNKNKNEQITNKAKSIKDYLDLYIKSKLKVREAYDRKYDTLPQIQNDVMNLRAQIVENYLTDPAI